MLISQLARIPEFFAVEQSELRALAAQSRILCLPRNRWVAQQRRDLGAYLYLLRGSVATQAPARRIKYSAFGELRHFYPGCRDVRTSSTCHILMVSAARREFLMQHVQDDQDEADSQGSWLADFLSSQMMQELHADQWQVLLKAFKMRHYERGADVVVEHDSADSCYVVESGHGVIHQGKRTLRHLNPGDFFGEDALILDSVRTATVTALEEMVVHAIDRVAFERLLLRSLVQPLQACGESVQLNLNCEPLSGALALQMSDVRRVLDRLDRRVSYYVVGGTRRQRDLGAFLLIQRGIQASPLAC